MLSSRARRLFVQLGLFFLLLSSALASAVPVSWQSVRTPKPGPAESIGGYSSGCVRGARRLPLDGRGYRVMRPSRLRMFGHPLLVELIAGWGRAMAAKGLGTLLIGDLGQPRGGPAPSGHASHQTGLDVDIWYWSPEALDERFTRKQRDQVESRSVVDLEAQKLNAEWTPRMAEVLKLVAAEPQVARVFVNPLIKQALCAQQHTSRSFLAKLRPWYGHDEHFHVRLACPKDSPLCQPQAEVDAGDGCSELAAWLSPEAEAQRKQDRERYRKRIGKAPELPGACAALLE